MRSLTPWSLVAPGRENTYLSTHGTPQQPAVNARDRIGEGPWYNAKGVMIAGGFADLHGDIQRDSNLIYRETALTEKGELVNGRPEGAQNEHDILTGSDSHGRAFPPGLASAGGDRTCQNWTYGGPDGSAMIGHHNRLSSRNTSHSTQGCSLESFNETGGAGRFYCFAAKDLSAIRRRRSGPSRGSRPAGSPRR